MNLLMEVLTGCAAEHLQQIIIRTTSLSKVTCRKNRARKLQRSYNESQTLGGTSSSSPAPCSEGFLFDSLWRPCKEIFIYIYIYYIILYIYIEFSMPFSFVFRHHCVVVTWFTKLPQGVTSLDECKQRCVATNGCVGIEHINTRCEIWTRPEGIGASLSC